MPTVLYKWDFETGDTQGWMLEGYVSLVNTSAVQGTYSLYTDGSRTGPISAGSSKRVAYIQNIDLSTANRPFLVFLVRVIESGGYSNYSGIRVVVKDSAGNTLLDRIFAVMTGSYYDVTKAVVVDLSPVAGMAGLTIEIYWYAYGGSIGGVSPCKLYIDNIHIIDGGDREYDIAVLTLNNTDRTITFSIPEAERPLPSGIARFAIALATSPHPLSEGTDLFTYTVVCDQGSASITSTDTNNRHTSSTVAPSTPPAYVNELRVRAYPKTAGSTWYSFDEKVAVVFWSTAWDLVYVIVFNVAITINPYSPVYQTAMINIQYGGVWSGYRDFDVKVHARSLGIRCYARFIYGDYTVVQTATIRLEVYSSDFSVKYGESVADLTTGSEARGSAITGLPVDTTLKLRISWTITASARVVIEVRPEFTVY
jgi:hypothetical protein